MYHQRVEIRYELRMVKTRKRMKCVLSIDQGAHLSLPVTRRMDPEAECYRTLETDGCRSRGMFGSQRPVPTEATRSCISSTVWGHLEQNMCSVTRSTKSPCSDVATSLQAARLLSITTIYLEI
jgi:hypothetical protein